MMTEVKLGLYQHYKGNYYQVIGVCRHSETLEKLIVYQALYGDYALWVRPEVLFFGDVEEKGQTMPRFKFIRALVNQYANLR